MNERYFCVHGHFYQPPRQNPWLEEIETEESAAPFRDWNARITAECYAPNAAARIVDGEGRILDMQNTYTHISFNFGPTLLSWLERADPRTYRLIIETDRANQERHDGHGNAIAQAFNHLIMPLANRRDKVTQVLEGLRNMERMCALLQNMLSERGRRSETDAQITQCVGLRATKRSIMLDFERIFEPIHRREDVVAWTHRRGGSDRLAWKVRAPTGHTPVDRHVLDTPGVAEP